MTPMRRILVATDLSACAEAAAAVAAHLATQLALAVELITVVDTSWITDAGGDPAWHRQRIADLRRDAQQRLRALAERRFAGVGEIHLHVFDGGLQPPDPSAEILRAAASLHCDLIVLGTHGKTGLAHLLIGSVAEAVVRTAPVPVLTVRVPDQGA